MVNSQACLVEVQSTISLETYNLLPLASVTMSSSRLTTDELIESYQENQIKRKAITAKSINVTRAKRKITEQQQSNSPSTNQSKNCSTSSRSFSDTESATNTTMLMKKDIINIMATQSIRLQVIPDSHKSNKKFKTLDYEDQLSQVIKATTSRVNSSSNHKQRPKNFFYTGQSIKDNNLVYKIESNHNIKITNQMKYMMNENTSIIVRYLNINQPDVKQLFDNAQMIGESWQNSKDSCMRSLIQGRMKTFGVKKGSGLEPYFF